MQSILSSVRLGYSEEELSMQGLGHRNLVLLFVLINLLLGKETDIALDVLTIEEPEAHLCINNTRLMVSFLKAFTDKNKTVQLFYSTHSTEFINKMNLKNVVVLHNGKAYSFADELVGQAVAEAVAVVVPHQPGLAVHQANGPFVAGGDAGPAAVAFFFVYVNDFSDHENILLVLMA